MKTYNWPGTKFYFHYPDEFNIGRDENLLSIYNPINRMGALQFSLYQVPNAEGIILQNELKGFIKDRHTHVKVRLINNYAYSDYMDKGEEQYWRYWLFLKENTLIFASYNCSGDDAGKEDKITDEIIGSALGT